MDPLQRFTGGGHCPKCTVAPVNAKYCEKDCSRGETSNRELRSAGGHFTSEAPPLGSDQPAGHLHRVCRACGYEWLEQTADARPEGADLSCAFCLRTKTECGSLEPSVPFLEGAHGCICSDCIATLASSLRQIASEPAKQKQAVKAAAQAH